MDRFSRNTMVCWLVAGGLIVADSGGALGETGEPGEAKRQPVLATFAGEQLGLRQYEEALRKQHPYMQKKILEGGRERFLRELVDYALLTAEARRRGYGTHRAVARAGHAAAIKAMVQRDMQVAPEAIPSADVDAYYAANQERFLGPEGYRSRSSVAPDIRQTLAAQTAQQQVDALVARLRRQHVSGVRPALLDAVKLDPMSPRDIPAGVPAAPSDPYAAPKRVD